MLRLPRARVISYKLASIFPFVYSAMVQWFFALNPFFQIWFQAA